MNDWIGEMSKNFSYLTSELSNIPASSGIYRLYRIIDGFWMLVYIGKALNIRRRIYQHVDKQFDGLTVKVCGPASIDCLEKLEIEQIVAAGLPLPIYNKRIG